MIKRKLSLLIAGMAILASAIGQSDWVPITTKDGFLTLKFPAGWAAVDSDSAQYRKTLEDLRKNNPGLAKALEGADQKDLALQVYDLNDDPTDGSDNMNVKVAKNPGITDKDLGEVGKVMIKDIPFKGKKEYKVIDMPFGKTLTYWGDMDAKLEDGRTLNIQILGYLYLKADKFVVCTFTTSNGKLPKLKEVFEKVMKSAKH
jgi:hypothetical protein